MGRKKIGGGLARDYLGDPGKSRAARGGGGNFYFRNGGAEVVEGDTVASNCGYYSFLLGKVINRWKVVRGSNRINRGCARLWRKNPTLEFLITEFLGEKIYLARFSLFFLMLLSCW